MKPVHFFFALYTLILACIPCGDEATAVGKEVESAATISAEDRHSPAFADLCSPFCICACCSGITLIQAPRKIAAATLFSVTSKQTFPYLQNRVSRTANVIWQPPRARA